MIPHPPQLLVIGSAMCYIIFMLFVRKLIWDSWNTKHIARHHVVPDEVEEICHGEPVVLRGQKKGRLVLIGPTHDKRILAIILEAAGHGNYYPITAYKPDESDIALYNNLRGGENNEK